MRVEETAGRDWDVIVVGAGPAGALVARELARRRLAVLLADRASFPRWKVCGCCLNGSALATLEAVGLGGLAQRQGAVALRTIRLAARGSRAILPLPGGVALSRESFDAALVAEAVAAGAEFLPQTWAALGGRRENGRTVILRHEECAVETTSRVVLAADGLSGGLLSREGGPPAVAGRKSRIGAGVVVGEAPAFYAPGTIFMACGDGGYVGLVRLEDGRLDIAAAFETALVRKAGGPGNAAEAILEEAGLPRVHGLAELAWRGTPSLTRRAARLADDHVFVLGDAAGYVEPFTGEGIAWALDSAVQLAPLAARACRAWHPSLAQEWASLYRRAVARRQRLCRVAAGVLRHPMLTRLLIGVLSRVPGLARPVVRRLNAPARGGRPR